MDGQCERCGRYLYDGTMYVEIERLRAELDVARADLAVAVGHLSRLAQGYGCEDFTTAVDAALAAKGE